MQQKARKGKAVLGDAVLPGPGAQAPEKEARGSRVRSHALQNQTGTEPQKGRGGGRRPALPRGRGARGGGVAPAVAPRGRRGELWLSAHTPVRGRLARSEPIPGTSVASVAWTEARAVMTRGSPGFGAQPGSKALPLGEEGGATPKNKQSRSAWEAKFCSRSCVSGFFPLNCRMPLDFQSRESLF